MGKNILQLLSLYRYEKQRTTQWEGCSYREDSQMDQGTQWYRRP